MKKQLMVAGLILASGTIASSVSADEQKYTIKDGDTLFNIAKIHDLDLNKLAVKNNISNIDLIYAGEVLDLNLSDVEVPVTYAQEYVEATQPVEVAKEDYVPSYTEPVATYTAPVVQSGGGDVEYAAQQMAQRTGTSVDTWRYIIQAESGGNSTITNPTGHYGYFQISPLHGMPSGASVDTQIEYATKIYNSQGFGAWEVMQ